MANSTRPKLALLNIPPKQTQPSSDDLESCTPFDLASPSPQNTHPGQPFHQFPRKSTGRLPRDRLSLSIHPAVAAISPSNYSRPAAPAGHHGPAPKVNPDPYPLNQTDYRPESVDVEAVAANGSIIPVSRGRASIDKMQKRKVHWAAIVLVSVVILIVCIAVVAVVYTRLRKAHNVDLIGSNGGQ